MHDEHGERAVAVGGGMAGPGDAFHLVIPSIPGCGRSGPAYQLGWDTGRVEQARAELMRSLGRSLRRHGAAQSLRQRGADVRPHVAFSDWPHIQSPVAVTRGTRWPCRG